MHSKYFEILFEHIQNDDIRFIKYLYDYGCPIDKSYLILNLHTCVKKKYKKHFKFILDNFTEYFDIIDFYVFSLYNSTQENIYFIIENNPSFVNFLRSDHKEIYKYKNQIVNFSLIKCHNLYDYNYDNEFIYNVTTGMIETTKDKDKDKFYFCSLYYGKTPFLRINKEKIVFNESDIIYIIYNNSEFINENDEKRIIKNIIIDNK
jgi:hypothetical protein